MLGLCGLALAVYAYLPLRANAPARPLLLWDDPHDVANFLRVVRAEAYGGNFAASGLAARLVGHAWLLGEGAARDVATMQIRGNAKLMAQLSRRGVKATAAATALTKGVVSACA